MFRYSIRTFFFELFVIAIAMVMLLPFWILVMTAFKPGEDVLQTAAVAPPSPPTLENFETLLSPGSPASSTIIQGLVNSAVITVGSVLGLIVIGSVTAYALVRNKSRWTTGAYYLFLVAIVLPTQLGVVPLYVAARHLGLVGTQWGMVIIYIGTLLPLSVFLYAGFFRRIPPEYEEAATIDGASKLQTYVRVIFPLMAPATGTVAIMAGLIVWNDFFTPLIFLNGTSIQTLPVVMYNYVGSLVSQWNLIFAVVIISMVPILTFYVFAQKRFIQGFAGGIKA